jgi:hypothetical protein
MTETRPPTTPARLPSAARRGGRVHLRREETARVEIGETAVTPVTARSLAAFFLAVIVAAPGIELAGTRLSGGQGRTTPWSLLRSVPRELRASLEETGRGPGSARPAGAGLPGPWPRVVSANRVVLAALDRFERSLDNESLAGRWLRPRAQALMTGMLGAGNERVYAGRDGWLFYRPDVEYLTGRGFLDPPVIRNRIATAPEWDRPPQPDPRPAILRFKRDLDARGVALIVMPTPNKPAVQPGRLARRYDGTRGVLQNPSYPAFVADLRRQGVLVFDPSQALAATAGGEPRYLATDTHWRPETVEAVADLLARFITTRVELPPLAHDPGYRVEQMEVRNAGDTARMLDLGPFAGRFPPETVWLRRVLQADGTPWRSSREADVLVLGDSFTNVYSLESMGWGTSAGLVERLSYALSRPADRLVQNDEGAFATRAMLAAQPGRLAGKKVVVYQFAVRELASGDWKPLVMKEQE